MFHAKAIGCPLLAGGGERREDVGDRGDDHDRAEQRGGSARGPARRRYTATRDHRRASVDRPERAERFVQPRREPVRPHARVGRVVDDREVGAQLEVRTGAGSEIGPTDARCRGSGCRRRSGCAGTSSRRAASTGSRSTSVARSRVVRGASTITATVSAADGGEEVTSLTPAARPGRDARRRQRRGPGPMRRTGGPKLRAARPARHSALTRSATAASTKATPVMSF